MIYKLIQMTSFISYLRKDFVLWQEIYTFKNIFVEKNSCWTAEHWINELKVKTPIHLEVFILFFYFQKPRNCGLSGGVNVQWNSDVTKKASLKPTTPVEMNCGAVWMWMPSRPETVTKQEVDYSAGYTQCWSSSGLIPGLSYWLHVLPFSFCTSSCQVTNQERPLVPKKKKLLKRKEKLLSDKARVDQITLSWVQNIKWIVH